MYLHVYVGLLVYFAVLLKLTYIRSYLFDKDAFFYKDALTQMKIKVT